MLGMLPDPNQPNLTLTAELLKESAPGRNILPQGITLEIKDDQELIHSVKLCRKRPTHSHHQIQKTLHANSERRRSPLVAYRSRIGEQRDMGCSTSHQMNWVIRFLHIFDKLRERGLIPDAELLGGRSYKPDYQSEEYARRAIIVESR